MIELLQNMQCYIFIEPTKMGMHTMERIQLEVVNGKMVDLTIQQTWLYQD